MDENQNKLIGGAKSSNWKTGDQGHTPTEVEDSLQSKAMVSLLDLLGEGKIGGLVDDLGGGEYAWKRSIFLDDVPLVDSEGNPNFKVSFVDQRQGEQSQTPIEGFDTVETPHQVGVRVLKDIPAVVSITDPDVDYVRVIVGVPGLATENKKNGDVTEAEVKFKLLVSNNGGPYTAAKLQGYGESIPVGELALSNTSTSTYTPPSPVNLTPHTVSFVLGHPYYAPNSDYSVGSIVLAVEKETSPGVWVQAGSNYTLTRTGGMVSGRGKQRTWRATLSPSIPVSVEGVTTKLRVRVISASAGIRYTPKTWKRAGITEEIKISGKTRSRYQKHYLLRLDKAYTNWQIKMERITRDYVADESDPDFAAKFNKVNETWLDGYVEITKTNLSYPNSALVGMRVDSKNFNSTPKRSYLVDGLYIKMPSNYDAAAAYGSRFPGVWNGLVNQPAVSSNPAWILYDLLLNKRYGLGNYITEAQIDVAKLYEIGKYCDEPVPDGYGGTEPRFALNVVIQTQADAYKVIADICTVFRGMAFWMGDQVSMMNDAPSEPVMHFSSANIIDDEIVYSGSARKDRHTVCTVSWNDPDLHYRRRVEYIENRPMIERFGIRQLDITTFGCTSRGQATRVGLWALYTEQHDANLINFKVGLDAALVVPGDLILITDQWRAGKRMGGRVIASNTVTIALDKPVTLDNAGAVVHLRLADGSAISRTVAEGVNGVPTSYSTLTFSPLPSAPLVNSTWVVSEANLKPITARVIGMTQGDTPGTFSISAIENNQDKYAAIEGNVVLQEIETTVLSVVPSSVTDVNFELDVKRVNDSTYAARIFGSWMGDGKASKYVVSWTVNGINSGTIETTDAAVEIDNISDGTYIFSVEAVNGVGRRSIAATFSLPVAVSVTTYASADVTNLTAAFENSDVLSEWDAVIGAHKYTVEVWSDSTLRRTVDVFEPFYRYTIAMNSQDCGNAQGNRSVTIKVKATTVLGTSQNYATVVATNPQAGAVQSLTVRPAILAVDIDCMPPADPDFSGIAIWISRTRNFVPDANSLVYTGFQTNAIRISKLADGSGLEPDVEYFVKVAAFDSFGIDGSIVYSTTTSFVPLSIGGGIKPGEIEAAMLEGGFFEAAMFASGIEPVNLVDSLPDTSSYSGPSVVMVRSTGKMWRLDGSTWSAVVHASHLDGQVISTQIADAAINTAKFAQGIEPVSVVTSVPGAKTTSTVFNSTDGKLYRWNGSAYVATVPTGDLSGAISNAQIADNAVSTLKIAAGAVKAEKMAIRKHLIY